MATLGLAPPESWSADRYVSLRGGAVTVGIQDRATLPAAHHFSPANLGGLRGAGLEIGFEVDDVDLAYAEASPNAEPYGGTIEPLAERLWGARDFRLIDPDGYYVRVTSRTL